MKAVHVRDWLLPGHAERDEGFFQEILSLSQRGLLAIGALEMAIGIAAFSGVMPWQAGAAILATGAATVAAARTDSLYPYSRRLAGASSAIAAAIICFSLNRGPADFGQAALALILLAPVAVPFRPADSAIIAALAAGAGFASGHLTYIVITGCAAVLAAATLYRQRWLNYSSYIAVLHSSQELQSRLLLADSSKTMNLLSAALAHELSSPIGTAASAVGTLLAISARQAEAPPGDQKRLAALQTDLLSSLENSIARLRKLVDRFHHVTNLDETATQRTNLNEILNDAVAAVRAESERRVAFRTQFGRVPEIPCRPQQLVSVFQNVLRNAAQAIDANGTVSVATSATAAQIEVTIEDDGRGIAPEQLARIFDPMFQVSEGRVSTGNWSLFTSRQFIKDHGGDIRIQSQEGRGTTVHVVLPC